MRSGDVEGSIRFLLVRSDCSVFAAMIASWVSRRWSIRDSTKFIACRHSIVVNDRRKDSRQVTVDDLEWSLSGRRVDGRINRELDGGDKLRPIGAVTIDVVAQGLENCSVRSFHLSVRLRVICGRHKKVGAEEFLQRRPEIAGEFGIAIRDNSLRETMEAVDIVIVESCNLLGRDILRSGHDMEHLRESATNDE